MQFDVYACNPTAICCNAFSSGTYRQETISIIYICLTNPCRKLPHTRVTTLQRIPRCECHELSNMSFSTAASAFQNQKKRQTTRSDQTRHGNELCQGKVIYRWTGITLLQSVEKTSGHTWWEWVVSRKFVHIQCTRHTANCYTLVYAICISMCIA